MGAPSSWYESKSARKATPPHCHPKRRWTLLDLFLVLMLPGAGDELQGIKKGVLELADLIAVNKADGDGVGPARVALGELKAALSPQEKTAIEKRPTENFAAYELFLKARELRHNNSNSLSSLQKQEPLLQSAVTLDPKFAWRGPISPGSTPTLTSAISITSSRERKRPRRPWKLRSNSRRKSPR